MWFVSFWMHEKSFMDFSAQRIAKESNSLVLKIAFIHALKCIVFCISNLDIKIANISIINNN